MRMTERMKQLKIWAYKELCEGREYKAPAEDGDIGIIKRQEPNVWLGWAPSRMDISFAYQTLPDTVIPGILIMPNASMAKNMEEQRFDRYNNINRPQEMGQHMNVTFLFGIYEPGKRLPGFIHSMDEKGSGIDMSLIREATEDGLLTLQDWMDDCMEKLLGQKLIPHTDLAVDEKSVSYSLYTDQNYVTDRRPLYYGFVNVDFICYANEEYNNDIQQLL